MRRSILFFGLAMALLFSSAASAKDVTGVWSTVDGESHVKIEPCGEKICGKIIWLKEPLTEKKNEWDDGTIYNPKDGKTYSSTLTLTKPDELEVDGCVMIFCKTQVWTRVE